MKKSFIPSGPGTGIIAFMFHQYNMFCLVHSLQLNIDNTLKISLLFFKDCPSLANPSHGILSTRVRKANTVVSLSCNAGFTLFGSEKIHCQQNGQWSDIVGTCINGKNKSDCTLVQNVVRALSNFPSTSLAWICNGVFSCSNWNSCSCIPYEKIQVNSEFWSESEILVWPLMFWPFAEHWL